MRQLLQATPAAGDKPFLLADMRHVELPLVERPFNRHRIEIRIDNELGQRWIAADVALAGGVKRLGIDLANDIAQVEIAIPDVFDIAAADVAQIAFFAAGHGDSRPLSYASKGARARCGIFRTAAI